MKVGEQIGPYRIVEKIGEGGMGEVFRAVDDTLGRGVALKSLRPELVGNTPLVDRFRSEARLLARLEHPNIATVYTLLDEDGFIALVMEYVGGGSLESLLRSHARLDVEQAIPLMLQALDGVGAAHASGVIHRDLKPSNVMLSEAGVVKLVDFGIARAIGSARMTRSGHLVGTLEYMAPEQVKGAEGDARSDVYSLGIVLFELLTGAPPFKGGTDYDLIRAQVEQPVPALRDRGVAVPEAIEQVLHRALAKDPNERHADAASFAEALRFAAPEAAAGHQSLAPVTAALPTAAAVGGGTAATLWARLTGAFQGPDGERRLRVLTAVLLALLVAEGLYLALSGDATAPEPEAEIATLARVEEPEAGAPTRSGGGSQAVTSEDILDIGRTVPKPGGPGVGPDERTTPSDPPPKTTPKPAVEKKPQQQAAVGSPRATIDAIDVHRSMRRGGAFARAAGYNLRATLSGGATQVDEVYELYAGGARVLREVVVSERREGTFRSRARIGRLRQMDPGTYDARLRLESRGRLLAEHRFELRIR